MTNDYKLLKGLFLTLFLILGNLQVSAQEKSDREKAELIGLVAKIKVESTYFENKDKKWVESERRLLEESEFDRAGKLINTMKIPAFGDPRMCAAKYKYDKKGRETMEYCVEGSKEKILEKYSYEEDRHGNWTKRVASRPNGKSFRPQWALYREITYFD
jgi:hypothetical protein